MTDRRFPFLRLPDDLRLKVLQTTEHREIIAFSFTSKKACSLVKSLCLPISLTKVVIKKKHPQIIMKFGPFIFNFVWTMSDNKFEENRHYNYETRVNYNGFPENMTTFNSLPVKVKVHKLFKRRVFILTWSNQGMSLGEWIQHIFSISKPEKKAVNEHEKLSAQIFLKSFLPYVQKLRLDRIRLGKHFSIGDFGMTNLKELVMYRPHNLRVEDLITLNAGSITICETNVAEISLRDLNSFFKLWKKGFNRKLKELKMWWYTRTNPDWNILLKGLKADKAGEEELPPEEPLLIIVPVEGEAAQNADVVKKFVIRKSRGFIAEIQCYKRTSPFRNTAHVKFTVS